MFTDSGIKYNPPDPGEAAPDAEIIHHMVLGQTVPQIAGASADHKA
jgi:hypothetical protein